MPMMAQCDNIDCTAGEQPSGIPGVKLEAGRTLAPSIDVNGVTVAPLGWIAMRIAEVYPHECSEPGCGHNCEVRSSIVMCCCVECAHACLARHHDAVFEAIMSPNQHCNWTERPNG